MLWGRANKIIERQQTERIVRGARRHMYTWRSKTAEGRGWRHLVAKIVAMVLVLKTSMMGGGTVGRSTQLAWGSGVGA